MNDGNFLKANNARSLWHPMTAPADCQKNPPVIVAVPRACTSATSTGMKRWMPRAGCGTSIGAIRRKASKTRSARNWTACRNIRPFAEHQTIR